MMTEERLAELEALAAAASPGPWEFTRRSAAWGLAGAFRWVYALLSAGVPNKTYPGRKGVVALFATDPAFDQDYEGLKQADCDFIAAARTAVPELVAEVRRLKAELARVAPYLAMRGVTGYRLGPRTDTRGQSPSE